MEFILYFWMNALYSRDKFLPQQSPYFNPTIGQRNNSARLIITFCLALKYSQEDSLLFMILHKTSIHWKGFCQGMCATIYCKTWENARLKYYCICFIFIFTFYTPIERNGRSMNSYATMNRFASLFENGLYAILPIQKAM